jgi:maltose/maltodextrin transport system permease protein
VSVHGGYPIRQILVALVVLPALYLDFNIYRTGNIWVALVMLVVVGLGAFIYLCDAGYTFRYLFPGFLGFGLFVIFPIVYMIFLSFTKYSSQNLLYFDRSLSLLRQETYSVGNISYKYKLYTQDDGKYILYLENDSDPTKRFASEPFAL